jgi:hypothetical protein
VDDPAPAWIRAHRVCWGISPSRDYGSAGSGAPFELTVTGVRTAVEASLGRLGVRAGAWVERWFIYVREETTSLVVLR